MLKKFFHPVLVVSLLAMGLVAAACSDSNDDGPKSVELTGGTSTEQTVYADETQKPENITFKAAAPWTATVTDTTPVQTKAETGNTEWLKLDRYSGEAGNVSLTMTLSLNLTGHDRKAEIRIVCGGTTLIITVEQKATTESGEKPEDPNKPAQSDLKNRIVQVERDVYNRHSVIKFTYDELGRLIEILDTGYYYGDPTTTKFTYGDKTVAYESICKRNGSVVYQENSSIELDENDRGVSGTCKSIDENGTWDYTDRFTYDANGQLVKTEETKKIYDKEGKEWNYKNLYTTTWTNGNPTQVLWGSSDNPSYTDQAAYETIENKTNLDLNWMISLSGAEGYSYSAGGDTFFAAMGYMGKRPKNMAKSVIDRRNGYANTYQYQLDGQGRITKIVEIVSTYSTPNEYTIHYAE